MKVILEENTLQLKRLKKSPNKIKEVSTYKNQHYLLFKKIINGIGLDESLINNIRIIPFNKELGHFGETIPVIVDNKLKFDVIFQDIILFWNDDSKHEKFNYALAIIFHEFYHCKEISITSQHLDVVNTYYNSSIDTTYKYLFSLALHQFSEYYAHYYSSKIYSESLKFHDYITDSYISLKALSDFAKENEDVQWTLQMKNSIESFINRCVIQLARYHSTNNDEYIHLLDKYKNTNEYSKHYEYYIRLDNILSDVFISYPKNLSEDFMINLGKDLMYIMDLFELTYSSEYLSDNFIFIHKN